MGAAHTRAKSLPRAERGIREPSGGPAFPARRHLEKFLLEVLRIESSAQENAACFGEGPQPGPKPPARQAISRRSGPGQNARAARPMQRCLLARDFRGTVFAPSEDGALAFTGAGRSYR